MKTTPEQLSEVMAQAIGSDCLYRHQFGIVYTQGMKAMAETAGAYWLIDLIASHQIYKHVRTEPFQVWVLTVQDGKATAEAFDDIPGKLLTRQAIEHTDFPPGEWKLYLVDGVLMIPSEY